MVEELQVRKVFHGTVFGKKATGRPRTKRKDSVELDIRRVRIRFIEDRTNGL